MSLCPPQAPAPPISRGGGSATRPLPAAAPRPVRQTLPPRRGCLRLTFGIPALRTPAGRRCGQSPGGGAARGSSGRGASAGCGAALPGARPSLPAVRSPRRREVVEEQAAAGGTSAARSAVRTGPSGHRCLAPAPSGTRAAERTRPPGRGSGRDSLRIGGRRAGGASCGRGGGNEAV